MNTKYPDFWSILLGSGNHGFFFGYIVLSYLAALGMMLVLATTRYKDNPNTPVKWSWVYFFADNLGRFIAGLFLLPLFIRLVYQYADPVWMVFISIGLGFGFLALAEVAKKYGVWTTNAISQKVANNIMFKEMAKASAEKGDLVKNVVQYNAQTESYLKGWSGQGEYEDCQWGPLSEAFDFPSLEEAQKFAAKINSGTVGTTKPN